MTFKILAKATLWVAVLASTSAQAALVSGNIGAGPSLIDTATNLSWLGFDTVAQGAAQGYRLASGTEFNQLLMDADFAIKTQTVVAPTWTPEDLVSHANIKAILAMPKHVSAEWRERLELDLAALEAKYPVQGPSPASGITYAKTGTSAVDIPGLNYYRNFNGYGNPETHTNQFAWVSEGSKLLLTDIQYNFVPSQCPGSSESVSYCGGNGRSWAAVGTKEWFVAQGHATWADFNTMNYAEFPVAPAYLMVRNAVPEPSAIVLMLVGVAGIVGGRRLRR